MAGEGGKASRKVSNRSSDEMSPSPGLPPGSGSQASPRSVSATRSVVEGQGMQPAFKKPRLDVSFMMRDSLVVENGGNSISFKNINSNCINSKEGIYSDNDETKAEDSAFVVRDCSTCGDVGFPTELFRCTNCCFRLQHTYCSNSYNPRKRWSIRLCNWCEAEAAALTSSRAVNTEVPNHNQVQGSSRRESPWSTTGKVERSNAVECLLGAALRLPSAGFSSVEDLLQVEPNVSSTGKRRRPPCFDSVEKARRSGPNGDINAVKSFKRVAAQATVVKPETSPSVGGEPQRSPSSSVDNGERRSPRNGEIAPTLQFKRSPTPCGGNTLPTSKLSPNSIRDVKGQRADASHEVEVEPIAISKEVFVGRGSSCDSSGKLEQSSTNKNATSGEVAGISVDKAVRRLSPNVPEVKVSSSSKSPRSLGTARSTHDERAVLEVSSYDNASRMKRSHSSVDHPQKNRTVSGCRKDLKENIVRSPKATDSPRSRESTGGGEMKRQRRSKSVESIEKAKRSPSSVPTEKSAAIRPVRDCDEFSENSKSSAGGGSDCSNITQDQQQHKSSSGCKDSSSSARKSFTSRQQTPTGSRQLVRPSYMIGKSGTPTPRSSNADEKVQKKYFNHIGKDSTKLRRSSSKIAGFHNYKSLSDILC